MDCLSYKTVSIKKKEVTVEWHLVNAQDAPLGRLASKIATIIRGKHKNYFTPNVNCGDKVVIINSDKVVLSGSKDSNKQYVSHTGYPGGQKITTSGALKEKDSRKIIIHAIKGMLPKNKLANEILKNLHVYKGDVHNQIAQKPKSTEIIY